MSLSTSDRRPWRILPILIFSQFAGTSLWFAGNAVMDDLQRAWHLGAGALGAMTSAVQFGFIVGTLTFAYFAWADRFSARLLFLVCALLGALANLAICLLVSGLPGLLALRFATGFFLAGIYPVGMKIAVAWFRLDVGRAIGFLVGALVLGTAFPHLLKALAPAWPWPWVLSGVSALAAAGGLLLYLLVPDGPHLPPGRRLAAGALTSLFRQPSFRQACCAYFGHNWELYAFWTLLPLLLQAYATAHGLARFNVSLWSFAVIAAGGLGCVVGGVWSQRAGSWLVALLHLAWSGLSCLALPVLFLAPPALFLPFLLLWGYAVVADSPQLSALAARTAPPEQVGSALTLMNCLGFALTIGSIQLLTRLASEWPLQHLFWLLGLGPLYGLWQLGRFGREANLRRIGCG